MLSSLNTSSSSGIVSPSSSIGGLLASFDPCRPSGAYVIELLEDSIDSASPPRLSSTLASELDTGVKEDNAYLLGSSAIKSILAKHTGGNSDRLLPDLSQNLYNRPFS